LLLVVLLGAVFAQTLLLGTDLDRDQLFGIFAAGFALGHSNTPESLAAPAIPELLTTLRGRCPPRRLQLAAQSVEALGFRAPNFALPQGARTGGERSSTAYGPTPVAPV
jgi:hypothetical protein